MQLRYTYILHGLDDRPRHVHNESFDPQSGLPPFPRGLRMDQSMPTVCIISIGCTRSGIFRLLVQYYSLRHLCFRHIVWPAPLPAPRPPGAGPGRLWKIQRISHNSLILVVANDLKLLACCLFNPIFRTSCLNAESLSEQPNHLSTT